MTAQFLISNFVQIIQLSEFASELTVSNKSDVLNLKKACFN